MLFLLASFLGGSDSQVAWPCLLTQRVSLMDGFAKRKKNPLPISISVRLRPLSNRNDTKHLQEVPPSQLETFFFFLLTTKTPVRKILRAGKIEPYSLWSLGEFRNFPMSQENTLFQNYALHGCCLHLLITPCIIRNLSNVQEANGTQGEHVGCLWRSSWT